MPEGGDVVREQERKLIALFEWEAGENVEHVGTFEPPMHGSRGRGLSGGSGRRIRSGFGPPAPL